MENRGVIATAGAAVEVSAGVHPHYHGSSDRQLGVQEAARHRVIGAEAAAPAETGAVLAVVAILEEEEPEAVGSVMEHQFAAFIDDLKATHGSNLASVILYGSAAAGDFVPKLSDYNILIALKKITPKELRQAHSTIREWHKMGHSVPVYFTVSELQNAADVFPIEFHQMSRAHKVLHGANPLAGLTISDAYLRHQTEYELRSKLIQLRRQYIPASASAEGLKTLMAESLASFSALFGAVLIMNGIEPPVVKQEIVAKTVDVLNLDGTVFEKIFNIREDNFAKTLGDVEANGLFAEYMEQIEKVIDSVDAIGKA